MKIFTFKTSYSSSCYIFSFCSHFVLYYLITIFLYFFCMLVLEKYFSCHYHIIPFFSLFSNRKVFAFNHLNYYSWDSFLFKSPKNWFGTQRRENFISNFTNLFYLCTVPMITEENSRGLKLHNHFLLVHSFQLRIHPYKESW